MPPLPVILWHPSQTLKNSPLLTKCFFQFSWEFFINLNYMKWSIFGSYSWISHNPTKIRNHQILIEMAAIVKLILDFIIYLKCVLFPIFRNLFQFSPDVPVSSGLFSLLLYTVDGHSFRYLHVDPPWFLVHCSLNEQSISVSSTIHLNDNTLFVTHDWNLSNVVFRT